MAQSVLKQRILRQNGTFDGDGITFYQLTQRYMNWQKENVKQSTYTRNRHSISSLLRIIDGDALVNELTADYVKKQFNDTGDDNGTLNERLKRFKAIMRWGYEQELVNDTKCIDRIKRWNDIPHRAKIEDKYKVNCYLVQN